MSVANVVSGFAVGGALIHLAINVAFPVPPIVVHSLNYKDGKIHQDRTITTDSNFFQARWDAFIISADTKRPVAGCSGTGSYPYPEGRKVADLSIPKWTGAKGCTPEYLRTIGGEFIPVAFWYWGEDSVDKEGPAFKP